MSKQAAMAIIMGTMLSADPERPLLEVNTGNSSFNRLPKNKPKKPKRRKCRPTKK